MRVAVENYALPVYKKNRIASLLCIFESTIKAGLDSFVDLWARIILGSIQVKSDKFQVNGQKRPNCFQV